MLKDVPKKISRRDFLKWGEVVSLSLALSACGLDTEPGGAPAAVPTAAPTGTSLPAATPSPLPGCLDPLSLIPMPQVQGRRYSVKAPDTLDIQYRAELALRAMTNCTDPQNNYAPYDNMNLWRNPPILRSTTMFNGKYMEATPLLRFLTGSEMNQHVDQSWRSLFIQSVADYPWWGIDGGRLLAWVGNNYRIEKDPCWLELGKQAVQGLSQKMVYQGDYCYYPDEKGAMPTGWDATWGGWVLQGLTQLYLATNDPAALRLAGGLARYLKDHAGVFDSEGRFMARHPSGNGPALHFHHNGNALEGISAYALAANDSEFASFAKSGYEWARSTGSPLVGFFPEYIQDWPDDRPYVDCETCCTADMIQMAMTLSEAQQGDYWDDADRYVRNQFAGMQLLDNQWIDRIVAALPFAPLEAGEDGERVSERLIGSFASWASASDWYIEGQPGTTFCCIGNGARALYYVWEKMIGMKNGALRVNLLLNRASPWADVNSYVPYEGQVDVTVKTACNLEIRLPEWVKPEEASALVNGVQRELTFRGRYALVGSVVSGDQVAFTFPISERSVEATIGEQPCKLVVKGNEVVSIDPPGKWYPLYQRENYRENLVRWVDRERFVPAV